MTLTAEANVIFTLEIPSNHRVDHLSFPAQHTKRHHASNDQHPADQFSMHGPTQPITKPSGTLTRLAGHHSLRYRRHDHPIRTNQLSKDQTEFHDATSTHQVYTPNNIPVQQPRHTSDNRGHTKLSRHDKSTIPSRVTATR